MHVHAEVADVAKPEDIWTALYLSGFLTTDMTGHSEDGACLRSLRLPNNEVRQALRLVILEWFECAVEDVGVIDSFHDGLCRGDEDTVKQALSCAIGDLGIDVGQSDVPTAYHLALQGLCFGLPGYCNPSSKRSGVSDRWDIQVIPTGRVFAWPTRSACSMSDRSLRSTCCTTLASMPWAWNCWRFRRCST